jgi:hypothetical protein
MCSKSTSQRSHELSAARSFVTVELVRPERTSWAW